MQLLGRPLGDDERKAKAMDSYWQSQNLDFWYRLGQGNVNWDVTRNMTENAFGWKAKYANNSNMSKRNIG